MKIQIKRCHIKHGDTTPTNHPITRAFYDHVGRESGIKFTTLQQSLWIETQSYENKRVTRWIGRFNAGHPVKPFEINIPDKTLTAASPRRFPKSDHPIRRITWRK